MSSEAPLTTAQVEDGFAQSEWDVNAQEEEAPRRERFRRWFSAELRKAKAAGWDECVDEAEGCGWIYDSVVSEMYKRNPYRGKEGQ